MQGAMDDAEADADAAEGGSLRLAPPSLPKMQDSQTGSESGVVRTGSSHSWRLEDEASEESFSDTIPRAPGGGAEDATGGQPDLSDGTVYSEQQTPARGQHAPGSPASDSTVASALPDNSGPGKLERGQFQSEGHGQGVEAEGNTEAENGKVAGCLLTCNFTVLPEGYQQSIQAHAQMSVEDVLQKVGQGLGVPAFVLLAQQAGQELARGQILGDLLKDEVGDDAELRHQSLDLELLLDFSKSAAQVESASGAGEQSEPHEDLREGQPKRAVVHVESFKATKPFLGGYRNKQTGEADLSLVNFQHQAYLLFVIEHALSKVEHVYAGDGQL